jgi:hypothetical protein
MRLTAPDCRAHQLILLSVPTHRWEPQRIKRCCVARCWRLGDQGNFPVGFWSRLQLHFVVHVAPSNLRDNLLQNKEAGAYRKWITRCGLRLVHPEGAECAVEYEEATHRLVIVAQATTRNRCNLALTDLSEARQGFCRENYPGLQNRWEDFAMLKARSALAKFEFVDCDLQSIQSLEGLNGQGVQHCVSSFGEQYSVRELLGLPEGTEFNFLNEPQKPKTQVNNIYFAHNAHFRRYRRAERSFP